MHVGVMASGRRSGAGLVRLVVLGAVLSLSSATAPPVIAGPAASPAEFIVSAAIFESRFAAKEILSHDIVIRMALVSGQESNKLYAAQNPFRLAASKTGMQM